MEQPFSCIQVFSKQDLDFVAGLLIKYDAYAILDEVYQHLVFKGHQHHSLQEIPGMMERSIRIGSAGKTFSFTGWKVLCFSAEKTMPNWCK